MSDYSVTTPKGPYIYAPSKLKIGPNEETIIIYGEDVMLTLDIVEQLNENIIADAFESRAIVDGTLCERLIRERKEAAETIEKLQVALKPFADVGASIWDGFADDANIISTLTIGHLRAAAAALKETGDE